VRRRFFTSEFLGCGRFSYSQRIRAFGEPQARRLKFELSHHLFLCQFVISNLFSIRSVSNEIHVDFYRDVGVRLSQFRCGTSPEGGCRLLWGQVLFGLSNLLHELLRQCQLLQRRSMLRQMPAML
jgi:hypothetical protein